MREKVDLLYKNYSFNLKIIKILSEVIYLNNKFN